MSDTEDMKVSDRLVADAKEQLAEDMKQRGYAAIIWNNATADFHYIPEIVVGHLKNGSDIVVRVTGLLADGDKLYAIEEGAPGADISNYYNAETDVAPVVVTLTAKTAARMLGDPADSDKFTTAGSNEEWLVIADCYFEALNER